MAICPKCGAKAKEIRLEQRIEEFTYECGTVHCLPMEWLGLDEVTVQSRECRSRVEDWIGRRLVKLEEDVTSLTQALDEKKGGA